MPGQEVISTFLHRVDLQIIEGQASRATRNVSRESDHGDVLLPLLEFAVVRVSEGE